MRVVGAVLLVALAAGCGGAARPTLQRTDATELIALAHRIAREGACGQVSDIHRLRSRAIALVNGGRVPAPLQESLMSAVAALADEAPVCLPSVETAPPPTTTTARPAAHGKHRNGRGDGDKHGKGDEG